MMPLFRIEPLARHFLAIFILFLSFGCSADGLESKPADPETEDSVLRGLEASLRRDVIDAWYPLCLDTTNGGYWTRFDANWKRVGTQEKFLVSQARQLWSTSKLSNELQDERFLAYAHHGATFLRDRMWDPEFGGFYSLLSETGEVMRNGEKDAYGNAFAIYALSEYCLAGGEDWALELAKQAFEWVEDHCADPEYGGYVDKLDREGQWRGEVFSGDLRKVKGTWGLKDYNSTIHLLEAYSALYLIWPDERLKHRTDALLEIVRDRMVAERGHLKLYFLRDWTHVDLSGYGEDIVVQNQFFDHVTWGHDVETAFLMLEASAILQREDHAKTLLVARSMVDHALNTGWDNEYGGLFAAGYYFPGRDRIQILDDEKVWWVEAETLNGLLLFSRLFPGDGRYRTAFFKQWEQIEGYQIDAKRGGWRAAGVDTRPEKKDGLKGHMWKANYHETRSILNCIRLLKGGDPLSHAR